MAVKLKNDYCKDFISESDLKVIGAEAEAARNTLENGTGAGSDFTGWVRLPYGYDKEEYKRIKNPQVYKVDLSDKLYDLKQKLIKQALSD